MKILVVEDELAISNLMKRGLEAEKYSVQAAYDGEEAFNLARTNAYDLIIMDIMLPKITGIEVTKKLREANIKTPIIMLTARDTIEDRNNSFSAGANDYLLKPFSFDELIARIQTLLTLNKKTIVS